MDRQSIHKHIYFWGLCLLIMAIPASRYMMSVAQFIIAANWLLEGGIPDKLRRFAHNKAGWLLTGIFFVHVIGLLWSTDLEYGILNDLKNKLPTLTLTFIVVSSRPLPIKRLFFLLWLFCLTVFVTSIIGLIVYQTGDYLDPRKIMPFIPHVYFSMMVVFVIVLLPWLGQRFTNNKIFLVSIYVATTWLILYLFVLSAITGILCLAGVVAFLIIRGIVKWRSTLLKVSILLATVIVTSLTIGMLVFMHKNVSMVIEIPPGAFDQKTALGNAYEHYDDIDMRENGHPVFYFIAEDELRKAWNERSTFDYDGSDRLGQQLDATLFRYMASLGLRKDREGLDALSDADIQAIERGVPNYLYTQWPTSLIRLHQTIWELYQYRQTGNPSGHTFTQRIELWKGSFVAFTEKPILGWGTGDIFIAVDHGLNKINSKMDNYHMKPHNQYLLFLLTLGLIGSLIIYLLYSLYIRETKAFRYLPFNVFIVILLVSMIGNNPIDAQTGQSFFTMVSLLFGVMMHQHEKSEKHSVSNCE
jgi:hypothetical protein